MIIRILAITAIAIQIAVGTARGDPIHDLNRSMVEVTRLRDQGRISEEEYADGRKKALDAFATSPGHSSTPLSEKLSQLDALRYQTKQISEEEYADARKKVLDFFITQPVPSVPDRPLPPNPPKPPGPRKKTPTPEKPPEEYIALAKVPMDGTPGWATVSAVNNHRSRRIAFTVRFGGKLPITGTYALEPGERRSPLPIQERMAAIISANASCEVVGARFEN
jgi:hypothetical protein